MKSVYAYIAALAGACALVSPAAAAPLEAYGRLPMIEDAALSNDGSRLAMIVTNGEKRQIMIRDTATNAGIALVEAGDVKLRDIRWAGSNYLLISYSVTAQVKDIISSRGEHWLTKVYDVKANRSSDLFTRTDGETLNTSFGLPTVRMIDGRPVILVSGLEFVQGGGRISLFRMVPGTIRTTIVETGEPTTQGFVIDEAGKPSAQTRYDSRTQEWEVDVADHAKWRVVARGKDPFGGPALLGPGVTPGTLLVSLPDAEGAITELHLDDGKVTDTFPIKDSEGVLRDGAGRVIGGVIREKESYTYTFFDKTDQAYWNAIRKAYGEQSVQLTSWSDDHKKAVVRVESLTEGPAFALVDLTAKTAAWIGPEYSGIGPDDIAPIKPVVYKAKDGLEITGYLTLPRGKAAKNLPLVVLPHGGPAARDSLHFDWWSQALAAQGYAVLQPNFRGSDGVTESLLKAGYGEFGRKMQTDLSDGVRDLAAQGVIDPKRVCIVGASYGGYAALAGATLDTGVYRCAISVAGPADLPKMLRAERKDSVAALRYWKNFMGVDGPDDPELIEISPAHHADKEDIPLLLIHGKDDTVVPYEQSQFMAAALKKAGKPFDFVTLESEDHWLSRGDTRQKMLKAVVDFLKKNNPPG